MKLKRKTTKELLEEERKLLHEFIKENWDEECWENGDDINYSIFFSVEEMLDIYEKGLTGRKFKLVRRN